MGKEEYWSLAQVVAWRCLRSEAAVQRVGEAADQQAALDAEVERAGFVSDFYGGIEDFSKGFFITGAVSVYGKSDGKIEQIPSYDWRFMRLNQPDCIPQNRPYMVTWSDSKAWYESYYGRPATPEDEAEFNEKTKDVRCWTDLRFPVDQIKRSDVMPPCNEDEVFWNLQETIGFIGLGYPLPVAFASDENRLADVKTKLRRAIQSGELTAYGRPYDAMRGHLNRPYEKLELDIFNVDTDKLKICELIGIITLAPMNMIDVRFKAADVRALFQPGDAATAQDYRNGCPGRPTSKQLVEAELRRRATAGELAGTLAEECRYLKAWLSSAHPTAPQMTQKAIENAFRGVYRQLK